MIFISDVGGAGVVIITNVGGPIVVYVGGTVILLSDVGGVRVVIIL